MRDFLALVLLGLATQAQANTMSVAKYDDAICTSRNQDCGVDDADLPADGSECPEGSMVDKPPQVLTYDDGACLTAADDPDSVIIDSPDSLRPGVPQIVSARITCNAGLSVVDLFTDAEWSTQIAGVDYDAQLAEAW